MSDLVLLATDTDVGKTTFALLWLSAFGDRYEYWKPVETGPSDTATIQRLVPNVRCHPPGFRFEQPIAPPVAAMREGQQIPSAKIIAQAKPDSLLQSRLLIESFGSPFSPLNDDELQISLLRELACPTLLIASSALGAIGRTIPCLRALRQEAISPSAVVLLGKRDEYAAGEISSDCRLPVFSLESPQEWHAAGIARSATNQRDVLNQIQQILDAATKANPNLNAPYAVISENDRQLVWHPYTPLRGTDPPLLVTSAQDEFLHLADGRKIIDGISSWWTILHGHRHPVLMSALRQAMEEFDHVHFAGVTHKPAVQLAEFLLDSISWRQDSDPAPRRRVFYSDNGSTAVEVALKMAYQFWCHHGEPQRTLFVGFENGYHGDTFGAMAASRDPVFFGRFEPLMFETKIVPVSAEHVANVLKANPGKIAAIIIEPLVQGAGGMRMHTPDELREIAEVATEHGLLQIVDEVMTGGARLGPLWAHEAASVVPDLICASKTLTGGVMPLAATLASPKIVAAFDTDEREKTFFHGHSFTAHPLACAVAVANWQMLTSWESSPAFEMEKFWKKTLLPLSQHPRVCDVRIRGSIAAVEIAADGGYLAEIGNQLRRSCLNRGVLLRPLGNVLYALPPLGTSVESLQRIGDAMIAALNEIA